jgi:hypothetical protein
MRRTTAAMAVILITGCGSSKAESGFSQMTGDDGGSSSMGPEGTSPSTNDAGGGLTFNTDSGTQGSALPDGSAGMPVPVVYAHSPNQLYKLDPTTNAITVVGNFTGACILDTIIDIALDENSNAYVTGFGGFYKLDLTTASCTLVAFGTNYPNSLSFVPKGTLDPNAEALVGYQGSTYVRIDTATGAMSNVGSLSGGYQSSGDIVSVIGGGTFLTVTGNGCGDCLLQVDPKTGDLIQSYGSVNHAMVYGLAFWAGTAYGFDDAGEVFSISTMGSSLVTQDIPVPNPPAGLEFYGAGSTTAAPPTAPDGGGIPIMPM